MKMGKSTQMGHAPSATNLTKPVTKVTRFFISMNATVICVTGFLTFPTVLLAQSVDRQVQVPEGCTAFLTVQTRSCLVSHHWFCEGDPEGTHWRLSMDEDGPFSLSFTDREFRWLRSWGLRSNEQTTLVEPEEDPASMTELFATGADSMVYSTITEGPRGQLRRDYTGFDSLTGEAVEIDGRVLEVTEFTYQYETGQGQRRVEGNQFVHRDWRMFFGGIETVTLPNGESQEVNYSPVEFAEAGEDGFLSPTPLYDCGAIMSEADVAPVWRASQ